MGNPTFRVSLDIPTQTLLDEIAVKKSTQTQIALTYFLAMCSDERTDWEKVNRAIIEKWSVSGLQRVKQMAHAHGNKRNARP